MRRVYYTVVAVLGMVLSEVCSGAQVEFEVASVKVLDPAVASATPAVGGPGTNAPGRYSRRTWLVDLLKTEFGVSDDQIAGGPGWLRASPVSSLYEIDAVLPPNTSTEAFQSMLQSLLVKRFHLAIHRETQPFPAFELGVAKAGPKLKEVRAGDADGIANLGSSGVNATASSRPPATDQEGFPILPPGPHTGQILSRGDLRFKFQERSMAYFAGVLGSLIYKSTGPSAGLKIPRVTDKTGLNGRYDFTLEFACGDCVAASPAGNQPNQPVTGEGQSIFEALEKQLGLKAVKTAGIPVEVLVVDHVDRIPTAN
jgi:uncharacterized protein (TIGR03435 family)